MLLALTARAVPSAAWAGKFARSLSGQMPAEEDDALPDEDSGDADSETGKDVELEKELFTKPAHHFSTPRVHLPEDCARVYHPQADDRRCRYIPDVHTPPPDRSI